MTFNTAADGLGALILQTHVLPRTRHATQQIQHKPSQTTQTTLKLRLNFVYGAQSFKLAGLFETIARAARRGVRVVVSIDGTKRSGDKICDITIPKDVFVREGMVNCGRSMLRRFQLAGETLEDEVVNDRLLLTW